MSAPEIIRVVIAPVDGPPSVWLVKNELAQLQKMVGGYIESYAPDPWASKGFHWYIHDEGRILDLPLNQNVAPTLDIRGPIIVSKYDASLDDDIGLSETEAEEVLSLFGPQ